MWVKSSSLLRLQVVIGTHGKLKAWASKRLLELKGICILVFDEADEMLKADGFADDSVRLIRCGAIHGTPVCNPGKHCSMHKQRNQSLEQSSSSSSRRALGLTLNTALSSNVVAPHPTHPLRVLLVLSPDGADAQSVADSPSIHLLPGCLCVHITRAIRAQNPAVQLLLFSATFNDVVKDFAIKISPKANHVFIAKEELSLDVIAQYNVRCTEKDKKTRLLKVRDGKQTN